MEIETQVLEEVVKDKNNLQEVKLTRRKIQSIKKDPEKSAKAVNLIYVTDKQPGIKRIKEENNFIYKYKNKIIEDGVTLARIKKLALPPAWENVWICASENGHLQATGIDSKGRKQYRYHSNWNEVRNQTKFFRMYEFGKMLPSVRLRLEKDIAKPNLTPEKVLATIVSLMERTPIRVGNSNYEKQYGSFGLTTLKDKHVQINGSELHFKFKGKKGVLHDISIKSRRLANIVKRCRDIPGKELFQYIDEDGKRRSVDSGMVNDYIKKISGGDFTTKDFRTWAGTLQTFIAFKELGTAETKKDTQKAIVSAMEMVAQHLGNTRNVCKKYYVHPALIELYESKSLQDYLSEIENIEDDDNKTDLTKEEKMVMKILETIK
jgi:DNA topoisomerase-1